MTIVSDVDPDISASCDVLDWDGKILDGIAPRLRDGARLIGMRDRFDVAFANDNDADRHGIVTARIRAKEPRTTTSPHRSPICSKTVPQWRADSAVGQDHRLQRDYIDRVAARSAAGWSKPCRGSNGSSTASATARSASPARKARRRLVPGAGRLSVWTNDKDGIILGLLAAEMTARTKSDPSQLFTKLTDELGMPYYERIDAPATPVQKNLLKALSPEKLAMAELAGEPVRSAFTAAPGNGQPFERHQGDVRQRMVPCAAVGHREDVYKIYAESFRSEKHLRQIQDEAQRAIAHAFEAVAN